MQTITLVRWTEPDHARVKQELEARRADYDRGWRQREAATRFEGEYIPPLKETLEREYQVLHSGRMIAVAYRAPSGWVALVIRDTDGKIVELDPTTLTGYQ